MKEEQQENENAADAILYSLFLPNFPSYYVQYIFFYSSSSDKSLSWLDLSEISRNRGGRLKVTVDAQQIATLKYCKMNNSRLP